MAENENGQEKSEQPSARRLEEATEKGNVAKSQELNSVAVIVAVLLVFKLMAGTFGDTLKDFLHVSYQQSATTLLTMDSLLDLLAVVLKTFAIILGPILFSVLTLALISNIGQIGFVFANKALIPEFSKISPMSGFKRMFSLKSIVELVKGILKLGIIGIIGYSVVSNYYDSYLILPHLTISEISVFTADVIYELTFKVALALLVMAFADFAYQKYEHTKNLKMTKQEVKDESKQSEGDPKVKGKIRSKQQEMVRRRMMTDVPSATVVVTNPTHYAVALRYEPLDKSDAPKVVAKGKNLIAQKIKEIAAKHDIPIIENKPLAQGLFATTEIGSEIPLALYQAVAEVLSQVYKANQNKYQKIQGTLNGN